MDKITHKEIIDAGGMITLPAVRGNQAKREFYTTMCEFSTISNHFKFDSDSGIPAKLRAQRKLRSGRIPVITNYILEHSKDYVFSAITVSIDKKIMFNPVPGTGSESDIGTIMFPINSTVLVNDGQHRCAAIKAACEDIPDLGTEKISVVIFEDRGLKRSQQMFADLNKHAVKPTKSLGLLYDHRDTFARFVVSLVNDVDIFYERTEMEKTNISNRSTNFFTLNGIAEATRHLLKLKTKSISSEKQKLVVEYWNLVAKNIPEWNLLIRKDITPAKLRSNYVHAHTNILNALGMVGYIITQMPDWKDRIKLLKKIDWRRNSPIWQNKVVMDGKMLKNRLGIKRAVNEILKQLHINKTIEGTE